MDWDGIEKRNFVRANFPCKIIIYTPREYTIVSHTENIAVGGVRIIIEESLDISSLVGLELFLGGTQIICKGRIVWVVERSGSDNTQSNIWDTGIEFYEIAERDKKIIGNFVDAIISNQK
ncbi:MAG: PilZ domain-containing protein [Candidatus Omnitrophota bacterium]